MRSRRVINAGATDEIRILLLYALDRCEDDANVSHVHAAITIEIVHPPIVIAVDEDVCSITELMSAVACATAFVTQVLVVLWSSES